MKKLYLSAVLIVLFVYGCMAQSMIKEQPGLTAVDEPVTDITGVLGAFPEEVNILLGQLSDKKEFIYQRIKFTEGVLRGQHVVVAFTGIGKVNAALSTILLIEHFHPKAVLFTGIAGATNPKLSPGDIVIGTSVAHHDYGTITPEGMTQRGTRDPATMVENPIYFPSDSALVMTARTAGKTIVLEQLKTEKGMKRPTIAEGVIVTGDVFVSSNAATLELRSKMNAEATEMEGAAVAQVCYQQQKPFVVIRSMSDNAGNNAGNDMESFYHLAARNSANLTMAILALQTARKN